VISHAAGSMVAGFIVMRKDACDFMILTVVNRPQLLPREGSTTYKHIPMQPDDDCAITVALIQSYYNSIRRNVNAKACSRRRHTRSECSPDPSLEHPAIAMG